MNPIAVLSCKSLAELKDFDTMAFATPWSARAFALVLAAAERGLFSLGDFQQALIDRIAFHETERGPVDGDEVYYSLWVEALTELLFARGLLGREQLDDAEGDIRAGLLDDDHDHDHEHGHHHDHDHVWPAEPGPRPVFRELGR